MIISTVDSFKYEWIGAPRNRDGIIMEIKSDGGKRSGPVHVALASSHLPNDKMYKITLGAAENTISWLGRGKHGMNTKFPHKTRPSRKKYNVVEYDVQLVSIPTPGILSQDEWRTFWLTWEKGIIAFGRGSTLMNQTLFKWKMDKKVKIQQIGFASAWGSLAEFR